MNREQIYKAALEEIEKQIRLHVRVGGRPIWLADIMRSARVALEAAAKVGDDAGALLVRRAAELRQAIELLPASQQQTAVSIAASNLRFDIDAHLRGAR